MSNFGSFAQVTEGLQGTAPNIFVASTVDNLAAITAAGYLNDHKAIVKQNDVFYINYSDTSTFPLNTGEASTLGEFYVNYSGGNWSLVNSLTAIGQAAAKAVTDNTKPSVASVDGAAASYTVGNFLVAGDTNGSIGADSGYGANNILQYASVPITAAQFNGMYAAPFQLIAAPGANKMIIVHRMDLVMTFGTTQFAAGGVVAAQYGATVHGGGTLATNSEQATDFTGAAASTTFMFNGASGNGSQATHANASNVGLYLSNQTAAFTTGDSTFVANIWYQVIAA